jgi:hypothetical protein
MPTTPTRPTRTTRRTRTTRTALTLRDERTLEGGRAGREAAGAALELAVGPVRADEFFAEYWERRPLLVGREDDRARFDDLLSLAALEELVTERAIRTPAFRLVKEGAVVSDYTDDIAWRPASFTGTARVDRVLAEFEAGATIVLQGLHYHHLPLARFCRALEGALGHPVQANAYFTPRASQGLAVHHDTHDVFVLQTAGEKRWLVYEPVFELPLKEQRYSKELGEPGPVVLDVTLRTGDTLYLPRGWLHEALTSDTDSLHLTVGVNVYSWVDALRAALAVCEDDPEFRRSVPHGGELPDGLLERLAERLGPGDVARRMRRRLLSTRRSVLDGQLTQLRALDSLTVESPVERRETVLAELDRSDDRVALVFEGKTVSFPLHAAPEVEAAYAAEGPFRAADLPGDLDDAGRLVLVRRLVREGFLRLSEPPALDSRGPRSDGNAGA